MFKKVRRGGIKLGLGGLREFEEAINKFDKDGIFVHVGFNFDKETETTVAKEDRAGFIAEFVDTFLENLGLFIVGTEAASLTCFEGGRDGLPTFFYVGFGDVKDYCGADRVAGALGTFEDSVFFSAPAANRGEDKRVIFNFLFVEVRQDPVIKEVGSD